MSKKIVILSALALSLAGAVYFGGVAATGYYVNDYLDNCNEKLHSHEKLARYVKATDISFEKTDSSFFKESGKLVISNDYNKAVFPVVIEKGFLSAKAVLDEKTVKESFMKFQDMALVPDSVKMNASAQASAFSDSVDFNISGGGAYADSSKAPFKMDISASVDAAGGGDFSLAVKSYHSYDDVHIDSLELDSDFESYEGFQLIKTSKVRLNGVRADRISCGDASITFSTMNVDKNGDFDLRMDFSGDHLLDYFSDYSIDVTLGKLNAKMLEEAHDGNVMMLISALLNASYLKVDRLDGTVGPAPAMFIGSPKLEGLALKSTGQFAFKGSSFFKVVDGSLTIVSDEKPEDNGVYFVNRDGRYVSEVEVKKSKLYINGQRFY